MSGISADARGLGCGINKCGSEILRSRPFAIAV